jgi:hypothetical protein
VSPKGTKHFVHRANHDNCPWAHESADHVDAKLALVSALRETGWDVRTEQCGPDWRADVLATSPNGERRVAFEVQLSPQSYDETVARQWRFTAAGVEGVWLFRTLPTMLGDPRIPMFSLRRDDSGAWRVQLRRPPRGVPELEWCERGPSGTLSLGAFARRWLAGRPMLRPKLHLDDEWPSRIELFRAACPACGRENLLYTVSAPRVSRCGVLASEVGVPQRHGSKYMWHLDAYSQFGVRTRAAVRRFLDSPDGPCIEGEPAVIRFVSNEAEYPHRFVCRWCPRVFSLEEVRVCAESSSPAAVLDLPVPHPGAAAEANPGVRDIHYPHWCLRDSAAESAAVCPDTDEEAPSWLYRDSEARRTERAALPVDGLSAEIVAAFRREGWSYGGTRSGIDATCNAFSTEGARALAVIGTADWSQEAIEELFFAADEGACTLFWFTTDRELAAQPSLARRLLIPVRAEREGPSRWRYSVVLGPGEEENFAYAMHVLIPRCETKMTAYFYI